MHSSRMRTTRSSICRGGLHQAPPRPDPPEQAPPQSRHPQSRHPLEQAPPLDKTFPSGGGTPLRADTPPGPDSPDQTPGTRPPRPEPLREQARPVDRHVPVNILPCPKLRLGAVSPFCDYFPDSRFVPNLLQLCV